MEVPDENPGGCDFLAQLSRRDMYHVVDIVFQYMDIHTIQTADSVSREWRQVIATRSYWEKKLNKKVCQSRDWKDMLSYLNTVKPDLFLEQNGYKKAYFMTAHYLKKQESNWKQGNWVGNKCFPDSPPCLVQSPRTVNWNADLFPPLVNQSFAMNNKWIVTAGENSKMTIRNRFNLSDIIKVLDIPELSSLPFPRDAARQPLIHSVKVSDVLIVACFYYHTEVCVWDAKTFNLIGLVDGKLFPVDWVPTYYPWHAICVYGNKLVTLHGGGAATMISTYTTSSKPGGELSISFSASSAMRDKEHQFRSVLDSFMDDQNLVIFFSSERSGYMIEILSLSDAGVPPVRLPLLDFSRDENKLICFHYDGGIICCVGAKGDVRFYGTTDGNLIRTLNCKNIRLIHDVKMVSNKYVVLCGDAGHLLILDLKKILHHSAENDCKDFELFSIQSGRFFWGNLRNEPVPNPSLQIVDQHQIGLAIQFPENEYSLFIFNLIGDGGTVERRRMFNPVRSRAMRMVEGMLTASNRVLYGIL